MNLRFSSVAIALITGAATACADGYTDTQNELFDNGFAHLDIASVNVTNDGTNLYLEATMRGAINAPDWGKYIWFFDTKAGGMTDNPWGRSVTNTVASDYFIGSWVDGGGAYQLWSNNGAAWTQINQPGVDLSGAGAGTVKYTIALADMGLSIGDVIFFDLATTGGGTTDPGVDHLSNPNMSTPGWGTASTPGDFLKYQIVPTPGVGAMLGLAAVAGLRRRR